MSRIVAPLLALIPLGTLIAQPLSYESRTIEEKPAACDTAPKDCSQAVFHFIEFTGGPAAVRDRINQAISKFLIARPADSLDLTPAAWARRFVELGQSDPSGRRWQLSRTVKLLRTTPPFLTLECSESEYTGGAHGSFDIIYLNFDAATGEQVKLDAVLQPGAMPRLTELGEIAFRKAWELPPGKDLKDAGFWFQGDRFALTTNFGIGETALLFTYNIYEVSPYSMGMRTIEIPLSEIRDLLRPGLLIP